MKRSTHHFSELRGFTLVELVIVIVIMGVIGAMVSVFMKSPIDAYFSSARRAALTDMADTTVRRMARDLARALPNSIRTPPIPNGSCMEFIPTKTGASYRTQGTGALRFDDVPTSFNMFGDNATFADSSIPLPASQRITAGDLIVVYNLGPDAPGADAYAGDNYAVVASIGTVSNNETPINLTATKKYPLESGSNRFHVVSGTEKLVSYVCSGSNLYRSVTNTLSTTSVCSTSGQVIASNVVCSGSNASSFGYSGSDLQRNALVSMVLTMQDTFANETVTLQHEVHVNNTP